MMITYCLMSTEYEEKHDNKHVFETPWHLTFFLLLLLKKTNKMKLFYLNIVTFAQIFNVVVYGMISFAQTQ